MSRPDPPVTTPGRSASASTIGLIVSIGAIGAIGRIVAIGG